MLPGAQPAGRPASSLSPGQRSEKVGRRFRQSEPRLAVGTGGEAGRVGDVIFLSENGVLCCRTQAAHTKC